MKETLEEVAENYAKNQLKGMSDKTSEFECVNDFMAGYELAQERSYSDMQEYATFCIECDRKRMPLLSVEDWYKHYKNK